MSRPKRPTPPPLSKTERQALEDLIRRGARALNPAEGNRLLRLLELDQADRQQERRTAGGLMAQVQQLGGQLKDMTAERDRLREHILDIDAHATPYSDIPSEPGYVGTYLLTAGALHRALGTIGHSSPSCQAEAQLAAVRALHPDGYGICVTCTNTQITLWPCPTIAALDGATE